MPNPDRPDRARVPAGQERDFLEVMLDEFEAQSPGFRAKVDAAVAKRQAVRAVVERTGAPEHVARAALGALHGSVDLAVAKLWTEWYTYQRRRNGRNDYDPYQCRCCGDTAHDRHVPEKCPTCGYEGSAP